MAHQHHITPLSTYLTIAATLLFLSGVTVWVSYVDLGAMNIVIAMLIATTKATLVVLFFMHLLWDDKKLLTIFVMSLMFLGIFMTITLLDTEFRGGVNPEVKDSINKRAAFYDSLPLTDTHGNPVDEHGSSHHEEDEDHRGEEVIKQEVSVETFTIQEPESPPLPVTVFEPYMIKRGDYLIKIASREYGDSSMWREIYEWNKQEIGPNPDRIYPYNFLSLKRDAAQIK